MKVGDLVRLKSGGPTMTVSEMPNKSNPDYMVRWFGPGERLQLWLFHPSLLVDASLPEAGADWQARVLARIDAIEQEQKLHVQVLDKAHEDIGCVESSQRALASLHDQNAADVRELADTVLVLRDQVNAPKSPMMADPAKAEAAFLKLSASAAPDEQAQIGKLSAALDYFKRQQIPVIRPTVEQLTAALRAILPVYRAARTGTLRHGPGGSGREGDCEHDCVKCGMDEVRARLSPDIAAVLTMVEAP